MSSTLAVFYLLAGLTVYVCVTSGFRVLTPLAVLVLGMFASGIVGALRHPPPSD